MVNKIQNNQRALANAISKIVYEAKFELLTGRENILRGAETLEITFKVFDDIEKTIQTHIEKEEK